VDSIVGTYTLHCCFTKRLPCCVTKEKKKKKKTHTHAPHTAPHCLLTLPSYCCSCCCYCHSYCVTFQYDVFSPYLVPTLTFTRSAATFHHQAYDIPTYCYMHCTKRYLPYSWFGWFGCCLPLLLVLAIVVVGHRFVPYLPLPCIIIAIIPCFSVVVVLVFFVVPRCWWWVDWYYYWWWWWWWWWWCHIAIALLWRFVLWWYIYWYLFLYYCYCSIIDDDIDTIVIIDIMIHYYWWYWHYWWYLILLTLCLDITTGVVPVRCCSRWR